MSKLAFFSRTPLDQRYLADPSGLGERVLVLRKLRSDGFFTMSRAAQQAVASFITDEAERLSLNVGKREERAKLFKRLDATYPGVTDAWACRNIVPEREADIGVEV